jgi:hypothetical protein
MPGNRLSCADAIIGTHHEAIAPEVGRLSGRTQPRQIVLDPRLVVRGTTGPPKTRL